MDRSVEGHWDEANREGRDEKSFSFLFFFIEWWYFGEVG